MDLGNVHKSRVKLYSFVEIFDSQELLFKSKTQQDSFFESKIIKTFENVSVVRDNTIHLEVPFNTIMTSNFLSFENEVFENKKIYCRIDKLTYINEYVTEVNFIVDYFQTYHFDFSLKNCVVEREHLSENEVAKAVANPFDISILPLNTSEDINVDEVDYIRDGLEVKMLNNYTDYKLLVTCTIFPFDSVGKSNTKVNFYNRTYHTYFRRWDEQTDYQNNPHIPTLDSHPKIEVGTIADYTYTYDIDVVNDFGFGNTPKLIYKNNKNDTTTNTVYYLVFDFGDDLQVFINNMTSANLADSIQSIEVVPLSQLENLSSRNVIEKEKVNNHNVKCNRYPFNFLRVLTFDENIKDYQYELFKYAYCQFDNRTYLINNHYSTLIPRNYKNNLQTNISEKIDTGCFSQMPIVTDSYLTYIANKQGDALSNLSLANMLPSLIGGGAVGMLSDFVENAVVGSGVANQYLFAANKMAVGSNQYHNGQGSFEFMTAERFGFYYYNCRLNDQKMKQVSDYFDLYGYKSGRVGVPYFYNYFTNGESCGFINNKTYVKMAECSVVCTFTGVANEIKNMLIGGVHFVKV